MKPNSLKQRNQPLLRVYLVGQCLVLAWIVLGGPISLKTLRSLSLVDWGEAGASAALGLIAFLMNGLATQGTKATLVFWRLRNPLPSTRFVSLLDTDPRIDKDNLARVLGGLPVAPEQQGAIWYRAYQKHENEEAVLGIHQEYLLLRDLTWLTVLLGTLGIAGSLILTRASTPALLYAAGVGLLYLLLSLAARNSGTRLILTVLAREAATQPNASPIVLSK